MAVGNDKMAPNSAAIRNDFVTPITTVAGLTALVIRCRQIPFSFLVNNIQLFCSGVTDAVTMLIGIVRPGRAIQDVTLVIGSTTTKFKLNAALTAVMPEGAVSTTGNIGLPVVVNKGVADNIAFSSAFTINVGAAAGVWWGAVRVQMDASGVVTTKVSAQDQAWNSEAGAIYAAPHADEGKFDMGTITIAMLTGTTFTAGTTALTGGNISAVNYNGIAAGFVNVCTSDPSFVAGSLVKATLLAKINDRGVSQAGGLIVVKETTTGGTGAAVDAVLDVGFRAWPVNGEVAPATQE